MIDTSTYFMVGYLFLWVVFMGALGLVLRRLLRVEKELKTKDS